MHIHDLHATILHLLGLDHEQLTYRYAGRDFRLTDVAGESGHEDPGLTRMIPATSLDRNRVPGTAGVLAGRSQRRQSPACLATLLALWFQATSLAAQSPQEAEFFETKIRPVLASCYSCHGPNMQMAGLNLSTAATFEKGSEKRGRS